MSLCPLWLSFNPRAREGRDLPGRACTPFLVDVSIHAPVRGATTISPKLERWKEVSIHAPVRGATHHGQAHPVGTRRFNPRAREGRDILVPIIAGHPARFNPRAREGRDRHHQRPACQWAVSIHAPVRGATLMQATLQTNGVVSIHAPVRGATSDLFSHFQQDEVSIHAPVRGATTYHDRGMRNG